jgi:hypothetical protein
MGVRQFITPNLPIFNIFQKASKMGRLKSSILKEESLYYIKTRLMTLLESINWNYRAKITDCLRVWNILFLLSARKIWKTV